MTTIHVCLVSEQTLANLIPALMERPERAYLVCSATMARRGYEQRLRKLLQAEGIDTTTLSDAPDADLKTIIDFALDLATTLEEDHPDAEWVVNVTGGNKLMALGTFEAFRDQAHRIIYTDTANRSVERLPSAGGNAAAAEPMRDVLDVPTYLAAQGFHYSGADSDDAGRLARVNARKKACKYLGENADALAAFIGTMNRLIHEATSGGELLVTPSQTFNSTPRGPWKSALDHLTAAGLLEWEPGSARVRFLDQEKTRFLNGGWLEEYAWHAVRDAGAHDARLGVHVWLDGARTSRNEFDVLATHVNQLLFMECKTLRYTGENDNQTAYKVESLSKSARGLFGETWLLTAQAPTTPLRERAGRARIRLLGPEELPRLREAVRAWLTGEHP